MTTTPPPSDDQPSIPDDVWDQFVRDTESDIRASAPKEPSARARMVTERLRQQDAQEAREAKGRKAKQAKQAKSAAEPPGWRTGPAWQEADDRAARKRRRLGLLGVLLTVGLLVIVLNPSRALSLLPGRSSTSSEGGTATLPPETAQPSTAPSEEAFPDTPTLKEPFLGSPAVQYADGAAGIELPKAKPVGQMTLDQVDFALRKTKEFLVDSNLNPATLRGARPETALSLIDPRQADWLRGVDAAFKKPGKKQDPLWYATRYNPTELKLVGDIVKTRGRMTFKEGKYGSVAVHADYTFVYPFTKAAAGSTEVSRTIVRRVLDVEVIDPVRYKVTAGKLTMVSYNQDTGNTACDVYDGYLHPAFASDAATGSPATGPTTDPYDRSKDITTQSDGKCGTVSRS
ncbi:hypothetical protein [Actinacidiphila soli]|uniref:hypothetical protein n=1 Tax=Actinacidiphila soli TaxID=2487275 RepID=UPI000FCACAC7|nr:hypothetical protein [Actinacidiphila soli]